MKTSLPLVLFATLVGLAGCGDDDGGTSPGGESGAGQEAGAGGSDAGPGAGTGGTVDGSAGESSGGDGSAGESSGGAPTAGAAGETSSAGADSGGAGGAPSTTAGTGGTPIAGGSSGGTGGTPVTGEGGDGGSSEGGAGGSDPGEEALPYEFACQGSDRAFVRRAILGVLGRNPVSQAEVSLYADMIKEIDEWEGYDPTAPQAPGSTLRTSRRAVLKALFARPEYAAHWEDLYRDFLRVQRVDEQQNAACYGNRQRPNDATAVAARVRDLPPGVGPDKGGAFTMADVIAGSIELDDMTPIYTTNLFAMMKLSYAGANAEKVALELSRRRDFGAWFDAVYLNRDTVCLTCHNSEFSVTQTADPATNRHYPLPGLLEKALFGSSMGPPTYGGYEAGDRLHAALRFTGSVNDCSQLSASAAAALTNKPTCATGEALFRCRSDDTLLCANDPILRERNFAPWGWNTSACGQFIMPTQAPLDMAFVETRFGNVNGLRATVWDVATSLRSGFDKLRDEGLGVAPDGTVPDPDKAFAYLTAMNIAEKVWREVVGTPLTIPTYFPRNAAARDQLQLITEAFIDSNYSNKALLEEIFASPYVNLAPPDLGCGEKYGAPRIFDPWVTAEEDPSRRGNSSSDASVSLSARTLARAAYSALGWPLAAYGSLFPNVRNYGQDPVTIGGQNSGTLERQFQSEVGFFLKNSEPGFRGLDFQARLGWEDRMGRCQKLVTPNAQPDVIDMLVQKAQTPGIATVRDLVKVLKDRIVGNASIDPVAEEPALAAILGASLSTDAANLPNAETGLRRVCGALISSPQFTMLGIPPVETLEVPALTPANATYGALCEDLRARGVPGFEITCAGNEQPILLSPTLSSTQL